MPKSLAGRRVLITGASRGIGLETARLFLAEGAEVLGVAREATRLELASDMFAPLGAFHMLPADLTQEETAGQIRNAITRLWGAIDIVVHNAAIMVAHEQEILTESLGKLEESFETNLFAPFRLTRALLPLLKKGHNPRVINVSSGAGTLSGMTEPGIASYRLTKWALNGLTQLEAKEFRGKISFMAFDPGWVKTDLGGPRAPGLPEDSARGLLKTVLLPPQVTGKLFKDGEVLPW
jgi:NAD(P)-dependent dehydrogenase (short-subunit alcohol dehydrogenase family)